MIPVRLNKKYYDIPSIRELNVAQLKKVIATCFIKDQLNYLKYIALFTGIEYDDIHKSNSNTIELTKLIEMIGGFDDYKKHPLPDFINIGLSRHKVEGMGLDTIGKEYTYISIIEPNQTEMDTYLKVLAVQFSDSDDYSTVERNMKEIEKLNWLDALSAGYFFFLHSSFSRKTGQGNIVKKAIGMLIKIGVSKIKRALKSLTNMRTNVRSLRLFNLQGIMKRK